MKRILILGANGQVGHELLDALKPLGEVLAATRDGTLADGAPCLRADLADAASLREALEAARADVIVNAAAYTAVDRAEDEPEPADRVNHRALGEIGDWARAHGALVVHYSTDYVFDGSGTRPYREDDATAPLGVYGRSKLAGEVALRASGAEHLIFRTAWVYAAHGHNFLRTMLRLGAEREELCVVADQVGAPTPARWIARTTAAAIERRQSAAPEARGALSGVFNLVAGGHCSWFEFAAAILGEAAARGLIARAPRVLPIATADYPTRARRPAYSVLDCARLKSAFGLELADWRVGVDDVLGEIAASSG
ncbi:dTDP-4-dehydrorhamnose reductase [Dokdonella sp.]|uniref:dTDP-4-dehydrorhamnose reductase n=1 Tax=Dokdonella sp. TaxID=2291710 RepID=UPI001AFF6DDC|nr:dTDP-4-dehydrorhamnose reductase [Dokdonella sp.]MBO9663756.1 dTDP-4-dehydrorhamnose reductase [Dokdonella sp.]